MLTGFRKGRFPTLTPFFPAADAYRVWNLGPPPNSTLYFRPFWAKHSKESYDTYRRSALISFRPSSNSGETSRRDRVRCLAQPDSKNRHLTFDPLRKRVRHPLSPHPVCDHPLPLPRAWGIVRGGEETRYPPVFATLRRGRRPRRIKPNQGESNQIKPVCARIPLAAERIIRSGPG